jgi:hypothetical protein
VKQGYRVMAFVQPIERAQFTGFAAAMSEQSYI